MVAAEEFHDMVNDNQNVGVVTMDTVMHGIQTDEISLFSPPILFNEESAIRHRVIPIGLNSRGIRPSSNQTGRLDIGFHAFDADRMECLVNEGESVSSSRASKSERSEHSARPSRVFA